MYIITPTSNGSAPEKVGTSLQIVESIATAFPGSCTLIEVDLGTKELPISQVRVHCAPAGVRVSQDTRLLSCGNLPDLHFTTLILWASGKYAIHCHTESLQRVCGNQYLHPLEGNDHVTLDDIACIVLAASAHSGINGVQLDRVKEIMGGQAFTASLEKTLSPLPTYRPSLN